MLDGFPSDKRCDVLKIQIREGSTPLHTAARRGHSSIITYLMTDLPQQQKYDLLKMQDKNGNTALHEAASEKQLQAFRAILALQPLQTELLNIKSKEGQTATDVRPEILIEYPFMLSRGNKITLPV